MSLMTGCFDFSKDLSLYIHVPFCVSKCAYCAFYSVPGCTGTLMDAYTQRLLAEIDAVNEAMDGKPFANAFIGGGNPGCLGPERLGRLAQAVCRNGRPAEFSTEMNPESLTEDFFPLFGKYFTRLSMGVQSLDPKALEYLGRNSNLEQTLHGMDLSRKLRSETGCDINYDLITCLGTWHDELGDVRRISEEYGPDHLSVYALTLEEGTPLYKRAPVLPDSDEQYEILGRVWDYLENLGFEHYEVSNFARPGKRCGHNCRYWAYRPYLGLGPGAASTAFDRDGNVTRINFPASVNDYVAASPFEGALYERLTRREACEELVLMGLRYKGGLDVRRAAEYAGMTWERDIVSELCANLPGFHENGDFIVPDDEGLMTADAAALTLLDRLY